MALSTAQKAQADALKAEVAEIKAAVQEIQGVVYDSLSIQNVGGSHLYNLCVPLLQKIEATNATFAALEAAASS